METKNKPLAIQDSNSAPTLIKKILTEKEQKDEINRNYLDNLSEYQQISYEIKNDKGEDEILYPNVNYQDESKQGFYIFYSNNLKGLKDIYTKELKKLRDDHPIVLHHIKDFLDKLNTDFDDYTYYSPIKLISKVISYKYEPIVKEAKDLASNLIAIKNIEKFYGSDFKKSVVEVTISDNKDKIYEEFSSVEKIDYPNIEINFSNLTNKYKDSLSYIIELDKLLNKYLKQIGENIVDLEQKKRMCFILNRASFYLSIKEIIREEYDLNILIKLDKLRRKINYLLLQNRFKFEQSKRPILDINIERCIILINSIKMTSIYIEKMELQKFIKELEYALERKANNLKEQKNFDALNLDEIRELVQVRDIVINSNEKIKEAIQDKIEELEEEKEKNKSEIESILANIGMELVGDAFQVIAGVPPVNKITEKEKKENPEGVAKKEGIDRINELRAENKKVEKKIKNYKNRIEKINISQNYDIDFINIMKLYQQLVRRNYLMRKDFSGVILTEKRQIASIQLKDSMKFEEQINYREYEIKEISKEVIDTKEVDEGKEAHLEVKTEK